MNDSREHVVINVRAQHAPAQVWRYWRRSASGRDVLSSQWRARRHSRLWPRPHSSRCSSRRRGRLGATPTPARRAATSSSTAAGTPESRGSSHAAAGTPVRRAATTSTPGELRERRAHGWAWPARVRVVERGTTKHGEYIWDDRVCECGLKEGEVHSPRGKTECCVHQRMGLSSMLLTMIG